jgi:hypothetical protein
MLCIRSVGWGLGVLDGPPRAQGGSSAVHKLHLKSIRTHVVWWSGFFHTVLWGKIFCVCVCVFWQQLPPVGRREANTSVAKMVVKPWSGSVRREVRMEQPLDIKKTEAAMKASCVCLCMAAVCSFSLIGVYFGEELYLLSFIAIRKQCTHIHLWTHPMVPEREERLHVYLSV